ncbi:MAG: phospholipid carrier-dependent glycosyltransferase [Candidatus Aenigmarchaeota archaeon]|nr:phospholipid carrier-dependent glycosyltransferase [Candidatus Aenigmarchaeota archaeon]
MKQGLIKKLFSIETVLIIFIFAGIFFRFYNLAIPLQGDEVIYGIASMKFHQESYEAGKDYVLEHPPLGKWLVGLPSKFIDANYDTFKLLGKDMFVWAYMGYDALGKNYVALRTMVAVGGVLSLILIFLIARKLFGTTAALWSTALASLSFELVGFSRMIFMETPMILFSLLTLYVYLHYLDSSNKKRILYLGLFFISLVATLLTRHIQPLFLLPIFAVCQFALNKNLKENLYVLLFLGLSYYLVFHIIFPQDIIGYGGSRFGYSSIFGFFSFKLFDVVMSLLVRNSLLFLASLCSLGYIGYKIVNKKQKMELNPVLIFFIMSAAMFSILSFPLPRHYIFMFIPLYILGGYALHYASKNRILKLGLVALAIVNVGMLAFYSPQFLTYTNFGISGFESVPNAYDQFSNLRNRLNALNDTERLVTNDPNLLIFFESQKMPIPPAVEPVCNNATISTLDLDNITVLYAPHSSKLDFENDPYICPLFKSKLLESSNVRIIEL